MTKTQNAPTAADAAAAKAEQMTAVEHRLALIAHRTREIAAAEAEAVWDAELLKALYSLRLSHITEALDLGVVPSYIAMVTGVGGHHVTGNIVGTH